MSRHDPLRGSRFRVEIDGIAAAAFSEIEIGATTTDAIDYREGTDPAHARKLPGLTRCGNVVLRRGVTTSLELVQWHRQVVAGQIAAARRNVVVVVEDEAGVDVLRFVVTDAWPTKIGPVRLDASCAEVVIESVELANEGIERVA
jgi:phage tail-like protein